MTIRLRDDSVAFARADMRDIVPVPSRRVKSPAIADIGFPDMFRVDPVPASRVAHLTDRDLQSGVVTALAPDPRPMSGAAAPGLLASTRVDTPDGPVSAGSLRAGDLVMTANGDAAPVLWAGRSAVQFPETSGPLSPVQIMAGAFGPNAPRHAVVVSARQTVRLTGAHARFCYGAAEVYVPAGELVNGTTICPARIESATMVHLMVDGLASLRVEGVAAESFVPCPATLTALTSVARTDLFARFPDLRLMSAQPASRLLA